MSAIQILVTEHDRILTMIKVAKHLLKEENADNLPIEDLRRVIDFIRNFADKYHHMKEEDVLFLEMVNHGMPSESGPIAVMTHEHNVGRSYVKQAAEALDVYASGDKSAFATVKNNILSYCELLTNHISKENNVLYPMAERMLPGRVLDKMDNTFEQTNSTTENNEYFDVYLTMVEELSGKYLNK